MTEQPYDPRAIANLMLDEGQRHGRAVTNLALQKLLYFAHALFLIERKRPLVSGYFEAWEFGPVHPAVYQSFKGARDTVITFRAQHRNLVTGVLAEIATPEDPLVKQHISRIMAQYGGLTPGQLVGISHAKGAPWHFVVDKSRTRLAFGLRIGNDVIATRFKFHKVALGAANAIGEPGEDTPPA
nr:Panacea domain-containing protein [Bradyrhizobium genosp. SA-3]